MFTPWLSEQQGPGQYVAAAAPGLAQHFTTQPAAAFSPPQPVAQ